MPADMMLCALEPGPRWCDLENQIARSVKDLPPAPVSIAWDPDDEELAERLVAALWRDDAVVLLDAVGAECCDAVKADMQPYLAAAVERSAAGSQTNLPLESEEKWSTLATRANALPTRWRPARAAGP